jgi:hypothetical protein
MAEHHQSAKDFLEGDKRHLRQLANWTRQAQAEVYQIAWVVALEMGQELGPLNFTIERNQQELRSRLVKKCNKQRGKNPTAFSLDAPGSAKDGGSVSPLVDSIAAPDTSDPLEALLLEEEHAEISSRYIHLCQASYSQFSAYLILLRHFDGARGEVCVYLAVTPATLERRLRRELTLIRLQPSLFDGITSLSLSFWPRRRVRLPKKPPRSITCAQSVLCFDAAELRGARLAP